MTDAQLAKASRLAQEHGVPTITYHKAYIEDTGLAAESFDCVISNGVDQPGCGQGARVSVSVPGLKTWRAAGYRRHRDGAAVAGERGLQRGPLGRLHRRCRTTPGLSHGDTKTAGLHVERVEENTENRFVSERAQKATAKWGVKSAPSWRGSCDFSPVLRL